MRTVRKPLVVILILGCVWTTSTPSVSASGIPTVDVAAIAQQLTSYTTQLLEFQEALAQTGLGQSQLAQMLIDYEQTLREYRSYLNQIRGLQRIIDQADWKKILKIIVESPYGQDILAEIPLLKPDDPDYKEQVRDRMAEYGTYPKRTDEVIEDVTDLGVSEDEAAPFVEYNQQLNKRFGQSVQQFNMTSVNNKGIEERTEKLNNYGDRILSLGDESDLATLQLMVSQQNLLGHQMEANTLAVNQLLLNYESPSNAHMQQKAKMLDDEIERLKRVHERGTIQPAGTSSFAKSGF